ncbi:hypothetical protein ACYSNW_04675 [Enterococcus sp. LJL99]
MSDKTLKHEIYKHGSYLYSLKESGSKFVNIDDEIKKFDELFELSSKKRTKNSSGSTTRLYAEKGMSRDGACQDG